MNGPQRRLRAFPCPAPRECAGARNDLFVVRTAFPQEIFRHGQGYFRFRGKNLGSAGFLQYIHVPHVLGVNHHVNMRVKLQSHAYYLLGVRNGSRENQAFRIFNTRMAQNFPLAGIPVNNIPSLLPYSGNRVYIHFHDDDFHPVVIQYPLKDAPRGAKPYQYHAPRIRSGQGHAVHAPRVRKPYAAFLQPFDCRSNLSVQDGI